MNHIVTLGIAAIVAVAMTVVAFAIPQQAFAHHNHHNSNSIKVDQQINQLNNCTDALCENGGSNSVDIDR